MRKKADTTCNGQAQVKRPVTKSYDDMKQWDSSEAATTRPSITLQLLYMHMNIYKAKTTCNDQAQVERPATKGYDDMKHWTETKGKCIAFFNLRLGPATKG